MSAFTINIEHPAQRLGDDLIQLILEHVESGLERSTPVDRRQFLSVESFDRTLPSTKGSPRDVGHFRLACHRFAAIGAPLLFSHVVCRMSKRDLDRLEQLAAWPHLCQHVKRFTYMVPFFYVEHQPSHVLMVRLEKRVGNHTVMQIQAMMEERQHILRTKRDLAVLKRAMRSFSALQHVQILRVQNQADATLSNFLRRDQNMRQFISQEWAAACSHGHMVIGAAIIDAGVPWSRFSSPMLDSQSVELLNLHQPASLTAMAERLTCLTLLFDADAWLESRIVNLSGLFKTVFMAARNMQAIHIGFPPYLDLPLENVFHHVTWEKLVAFGVQGWTLDSRSILKLALRHRSRLKGLRLRDVLLKNGSTWRQVLVGLRGSMYRLDWVSLRRIGYLRYQGRLNGVEVPHLESESESDVEDYDPVVESSQPVQGRLQQDGEASSSTQHLSADEDDSFDAQSLTADSDDEYGPEAHGLDFPSMESPTVPSSTSEWNGIHLTSEDLDDDGLIVSNTKRKLWERWVVRK